MKGLLLLGGAALGLWIYRNAARWHERYPDVVTSKRGDAPNAPANVSGFRITSPAFEPGRPIPAKYSCEADDKSPPLRFEGMPEGARSLALIMEDLNSPIPPVFTHWLVWNIPPETAELPEGLLPARAVQGRNSFKNSFYNGPCTPNGTHHYHFKLFALDTELDLPAGSDKKELKAAMKGHILAQSELIGLYTANRITRGNLSMAMLEAAGKA